MQSTVNVQFSQRDRFKRQRAFEVFNEHYLRVHYKDAKQERRYTLNLLALAPVSERTTRLAWLWLAGALAALAATGGFLAALMSRLAGEGAVYFLAGAALALIVTGLLGYQFVAHSERKQVFATRYGVVPLVEISVDRPDRATFHRFVEDLERRIDEATQRSGLNDEALKAGEVRMLRRLTGKGILQQQDYERAKALIFGQVGRD